MHRKFVYNVADKFLSIVFLKRLPCLEGFCRITTTSIPTKVHYDGFSLRVCLFKSRCPQTFWTDVIYLTLPRRHAVIIYLARMVRLSSSFLQNSLHRSTTRHSYTPFYCIHHDVCTLQPSSHSSHSFPSPMTAPMALGIDKY